MKTTKLSRCERHIIKPSDKRYKIIEILAHKSKNLYNFCNYRLRQEFIIKQPQIKEYDFTTLLAKENQIDYKSLPSQTSQQIIKLLYKNWKSFFVSLKSYQKDKSKFTSYPKLPKYKKKDGVNIVIFTNQQISLKSDNKIYFPKMTNLKPLKTKIDKSVSTIKQVRFIPKTTCFIVEIVYELDQIQVPLKDSGFLGIDLGLNNFVTAIDNQSKQPFIINGKGLKSVNQFYNKLKANYQAKAKISNDRFFTKRLNKLSFNRNQKIENFTHKASDFIVKHCVKHQISQVIVGKNDEWKQNINLGKKTNQNFTSIPFESFIQKLAYKCENYGIKLIEIEESYTSKTDHLAGEILRNISDKNDEKIKYLGKRVKRGLFRSSTGKYINADLNGAIGICRKVFRDAVNSLTDSGTAFVPIKINLAF